MFYTGLLAALCLDIGSQLLKSPGLTSHLVLLLLQRIVSLFQFAQLNAQLLSHFFHNSLLDPRFRTLLWLLHKHLSLVLDLLGHPLGDGGYLLEISVLFRQDFLSLLPPSFCFNCLDLQQFLPVFQIVIS